MLKEENIINVSNCDELFSKLESFGSDFIYRGQQNSTWPLNSSKDRLREIAFKHPNSGKGLTEYISTYYRTESVEKKFDAFAHLFSPEVPAFKDIWSKLSYLQHHGWPTDLVDFSFSPYVALFFALDTDGIAQKSTIYVANKQKVREKTNEMIRGAVTRQIEKNTDKDVKRHVLKIQRKYYDEGDHFYFNIASRYVVGQGTLHIVEPEDFNIRIKSQQGCFLTARTGSDSSMEEVINVNYYDSFKQIIFPSSLRYEIHKRLVRMNVVATSLFPSLAGVIEEANRSVKLGIGSMLGG